MFICIFCLKEKTDAEKGHLQQTTFRYCDGWFCRACCLNPMEWVQKIIRRIPIDRVDAIEGESEHGNARVSQRSQIAA